ncbi:UV DNA damage repair endonuclease UvsE [Paenibacillus aurantius]|uniref:UV DNA damage repair endonuclease UvsE n=1 Tax=Paenibacillus aurantius TaxID=2918900 RepID=A0AA96LF57_9BACL|nr:UV DNA damage repair endonuclease UvsE [Paenibacillus aurantius]WNQ12120.1 UV DNA damage repair endonuclease UvsE [Paenibacillus aurantius]
MIVRFGYVAMSVSVSNASPSKTMTATHFAKLADREAAVRKLERIAAENLHNTLRLLRHNRAYDIHVFRFSSKLVPLWGHELLEGWNPLDALAGEFAELGEYVRTHGMRTSFHPDHFTVLTTPREEVLKSSIADLGRHSAMLEAMGLDERAKCNIHMGGTYGNKEAASARFVQRFPQLDEKIRSRLTLENDDKTFTAAETLAVCEELGIPMVLDIHHHQVNNGGEPASGLWPRIRRTWERAQESISGDKSPIPPKIHASSPKSDKDIRAHADFVEAGALLGFLREIAKDTPRLDVMLEAKQKDASLFRLMEELPGEPGIRRVDQATIELEG